VLDPLVVSGRLPRILLVGIHSSESSEGRGAEYLTSFVEGDAPFLAHERFFLGEVMPWVEKRYRLPDDASRRAVFGFSNSAAWALEMTLRHPQKFGRVLAFSPGGRRPSADEALPAKARFYLLAGTMEKGFHDIAVRWAKTAEERGVTHVLRTPVAGHDFEMWTSMLPDALQWAFGGTKREA
jgi:enterochelin esterase-like enzyme